MLGGIDITSDVSRINSLAYRRLTCENINVNANPTKIVTLARGDQRLIIVIRQLPHDEQAVVGTKLRHGAGAKWLVVEIQ